MVIPEPVTFHDAAFICSYLSTEIFTVNDELYDYVLDGALHWWLSCILGALYHSLRVPRGLQICHHCNSHVKHTLGENIEASR